MSNYTFRIGEDESGKPVRMDLPTLIETRLFDLASSGGGKSYALRVLIEKTAGHVQWIVIDPEGEFASLREKFDFLLVGKDGEVPVDVRSAKLLARKLMETRASAIIDLYGLSELGVTWVADFLPELMNLPKALWSPVIVAIDEAHKFARESVKGKESDSPARARKAVVTLSDSGRKQSRGCVIATQRISKLAADARAELRNNLIGLTVQDLDRDRAADILGIPKKGNDVLRELNAGEFFAFGPAFVSHKGVFRMKVDPATTKHPKPGEGRLLAVPEASKAVKVLLSEMGDLPQQAQEEAEGLQAAQREIIQLRRELQQRPVQVQPKTEIQIVEKPVLNGEVPALLEGIRELSATLQPLQQLPQTVQPVVDLLKVIVEKVERVEKGQAMPVRLPQMQPRPTPVIAKRSVVVSQPIESGELAQGERKILQAVAQYDQGAARDQLTVLTGYKRSTRDAYIQRLQQKGYVETSGSGGAVRATSGGIAALGADYEPLPVGLELQAYWRQRLPEGERIILDVAIAQYPDAVERSVLDEVTPYKRSTRDAYIQRLLAKRLVTAERGAIRASKDLF